MITEGFLSLTIVVLIAATLGLVARLFKQPVILAYIFTGLIIGIFQAYQLEDAELFKTLSQLGIMFLLFLIGLEINYTSLRLAGRVSIIAGLAQVIFTSAIGFLIALPFGFSYLEAAYIGVALAFSSTIIVVKLLSEKRDLNSLYGKISVGMLLVQDFLAIFILIFLTGIQLGHGLIFKDIFLTFLKGVGLIILMFWIGRRLMPYVFDRIAKSQELLFLGSLAWCLGIAALVMKTGFSLEIGGFLAGLALANTSEAFQISARIRPLRDFFILIFFVILGSSLTFSSLGGITLPVLVFSLFVLIGNPLIVLIIMGFMGYRKRTSFLCGVTVAQISEFSLILAAMGFTLGHLTSSVVSLITMVGIITITLSTYLIIYGEEIFRFLKRYLTIFERRAKSAENGFVSGFDKSFILIGSHRIGQNIAQSLPKENLLIIDFDPEIVSQLKRQGYTSLFGDIADSEIMERANIKNAKLVISTSPDLEDNLRILSEVGAFETKPKIILRAEDEKDALLLYEKGADYVLLPHFTSGQYLGRSISVDPELKILEQLKTKDLEGIKKTRPIP